MPVQKPSFVLILWAWLLGHIRFRRMRWEHGRFDQAWMNGPTVRTICTGNIHAIILWAWMLSTQRNHGRHILKYVVILHAWICSPTVCISNVDVILRERMLGSAVQKAATKNTHSLQAKPTQRGKLHHPHKKPQTSKTRGKHAAQGKLRSCRVRVAGLSPGTNYCGLPR